MITVFNRKELMITMDFNKYADVKEVLSAHNIPHVTKTANLTNAQAVGSHSGYQGSLGVNQKYSYEYKIYVHKRDYDKAVGLISFIVQSEVQ